MLRLRPSTIVMTHEEVKKTLEMNLPRPAASASKSSSLPWDRNITQRSQKRKGKALACSVNGDLDEQRGDARLPVYGEDDGYNAGTEDVIDDDGSATTGESLIEDLNMQLGLITSIQSALNFDEFNGTRDGNDSRSSRINEWIQASGRDDTDGSSNSRNSHFFDIYPDPVEIASPSASESLNDVDYLADEEQNGTPSDIETQSVLRQPLDLSPNVVRPRRSPRRRAALPQVRQVTIDGAASDSDTTVYNYSHSRNNIHSQSRMLEQITRAFNRLNVESDSIPTSIRSNASSASSNTATQYQAHHYGSLHRGHSIRTSPGLDYRTPQPLHPSGYVAGQRLNTHYYSPPSRQPTPIRYLSASPELYTPSLSQASTSRSGSARLSSASTRASESFTLPRSFTEPIYVRIPSPAIRSATLPRLSMVPRLLGTPSESIYTRTTHSASTPSTLSDNERQHYRETLRSLFTSYSGPDSDDGHPLRELEDGSRAIRMNRRNTSGIWDVFVDGDDVVDADWPTHDGVDDDSDDEDPENESTVSDEESIDGRISPLIFLHNRLDEIIDEIETETSSTPEDVRGESSRKSTMTAEERREMLMEEAAARTRLIR